MLVAPSGLSTVHTSPLCSVRLFRDLALKRSENKGYTKSQILVAVHSTLIRTQDATQGLVGPLDAQGPPRFPPKTLSTKSKVHKQWKPPQP